MSEESDIMYRIRLDEAARQELNRRAHQPGVKARTRDRLEIVRLSDAGWSVPRIARHFGRSERCVRLWIKAFLHGGFDALPDQPHPGQKSALTPDLLQAIRAQVGKGERTWTAGQIADWLCEQHGVRLAAAWLSRLLRRAKLSYKRTSRTLAHKHKPEEVARKKADLATLEKGAMPDR
jgi:transposase